MREHEYCYSKDKIRELTERFALILSQKDAEIQQAAWHALDVCPFTLPSSGDASREFENA